MAEAEDLAQRGAKRVQQLFSGWQVRHEAQNGSPGFALLHRAREWQADLIVVGSQGRSALGRLVLGSVSQRVLTESSTSVHIGRLNPAVESQQSAFSSGLMVLKEHSPRYARLRSVIGPRAARSALLSLTML